MSAKTLLGLVEPPTGTVLIGRRRGDRVSTATALPAVPRRDPDPQKSEIDTDKRNFEKKIWQEKVIIYLVNGAITLIHRLLAPPPRPDLQ